MKGTKFENSLLSNLERNRLPVPIAPRGRLATYGQNSWYADFCVIVEGNIFSAPIVQGHWLDALVFDQDTPIIHAIYSHYTDATAPWIFEYWDFREPSVINTNLAGNLVLVADKNACLLEEQATGLTITNAVRVAGHRISATITGRSLVHDQTPLPCTLQMLCITKGSVSSGPERFYRAATADRPILLLETQYTQAMHDAGNVLVIGAISFRIVGIYQTVTLVP